MILPENNYIKCIVNLFVLILSRDVLTIAAVDAVTCILAGFAIFSTLGFLAHNQGKEVEDVISQGKFYRTQGYMMHPILSTYYVIFIKERQLWQIWGNFFRLVPPKKVKNKTHTKFNFIKEWASF